ncbi:General transcription factor 3C polypeptide 1 [Halotydeus destructor]|nr:General transcription factor 3C polypeptide 1 [Halotydeus destructor]
MDYKLFVYDEVALEGLEGITLETLWVRLKTRPGFGLNVDEPNVRQYLWKTILSSASSIPNKLEFYVLPEPRPVVVYYNRFEHVHLNSGTYVEKPDLIPDDPYPLHPVKGQTVNGSCQHFETRLSVSDKILSSKFTLQEIAEKYGCKLVVVASQLLRNESLGINKVDPCFKISDMIYCYLEKIGRSRHLGQITVGKEAAISTVKPKTAFYYRKRLLKRELIKKAPHYIVNPATQNSTKGYCIFLTRFYQRRLTSLEITAKRISDHLLQCHDHMIDYLGLKNALHQTKSVFRHVFGNYPANFEFFTADLEQGEKTVKRKFVKLIKPINNDEDEEENESSASDEDNEGESSSLPDQMQNFRFFKPRFLLTDRTILSHVLSSIENCESPDGLSLTEIGQKMSLTKLDARGFVRNLERNGFIKAIKVDIGRTKIAKYLPLSKIEQSNREFAKASKALNHGECETLLTLKRTNLILDYIEALDVKVVDGLHVLKKVILDAEVDKPHAIDKKTVRTLVSKLHRAGKIKVFETTHTINGRTHDWCLVCHSSIADDSQLIKDKKQQWLFRIDTHYIKPDNAENKKLKKLRSQAKNKDELEDLELCVGMEYQPTIGRKYGVEPKMRKILTLYSFMHHLMYVMPNFPAEYADWRKYIHPLPEGSKPFTCTLEDIIPRLPLAIYVKIVFLTYVIPGLQDYLDDHERSFETICMLPADLRKRLMFKRKHMFALHDLFVSMSYLGLAEVDYKETYPKETLKVKITNETSFKHNGEMRKYELWSLEDISGFTDDLMSHCVVDICEDCSIHQKLYPHNHRNWTFYSKVRQKETLSDYNRQMQRLTNHSLVLRDNPMRYTIVNKSTLTENKRGKKRKKAGNDSNEDTVKSLEEKEPKRKKRKKPRKPKAEHLNRGRKPTYDEKDRVALQLMKKQRVNWTPQEDNFLLLCRVTSVVLDPKCPFKTCVSRNVLRDELHKAIPTSTDKTALACQRRILYMLKDSRTVQNISEWVAEFKQEAGVGDTLRPSVPRTYEKEWIEAFLPLLEKVSKKYSEPSQIPSFSPSADLNIDDCEITQPSLMVIEKKKEPVFLEPRNIVDVHVNVVDNVLLSALLHNSNEDLPISAFSYALFKIYQRYPDTLIRSVVAKLQKNSIMVKHKVRRMDASSIKQRGVIPYKLSQHYVFLLQTKFSMTTLIEDLKSETQDFFDDGNRFNVAMITTLFASNNAEISIDVPDNFIVLDDQRLKINKPGFFDDPRNSSRSLVAYRQHLSSVRGDISSQNIQEMLMLAKCKVTCTAKNPEKLDSVKFINHLEYMKKTLDVNGDEPKIALIDVIKRQKELGASRDQIIAACGSWPHTVIAELESNNFIYRLGVNEFRWVHRQFITPWIVHSVIRDENDEDKVVRYIARTWKKPNGAVDYKTLYMFAHGILGHIMSFPGIKENDLLSYFRISMPAAQALEIIELLIVAGCVVLTEKTMTEKPSLFSRTERTRTFKFYETTPDSLLKLSHVKTFLCSSN